MLQARRQGKPPATRAGRIPHTKRRADGYVFDSTAEWIRYEELKMLLAMGRIRNLQIHPKFTFVVNDMKIGTYTSDSAYDELTKGKWVPVVEDVKSKFTVKDPQYRRQKKLMLAHHGIDIREIIYD